MFDTIRKRLHRAWEGFWDAEPPTTVFVLATAVEQVARSLGELKPTALSRKRQAAVRVGIAAWASASAEALMEEAERIAAPPETDPELLKTVVGDAAKTGADLLAQVHEQTMKLIAQEHEMQVEMQAAKVRAVADALSFRDAASKTAAFVPSG